MTGLVFFVAILHQFQGVPGEGLRIEPVPPAPPTENQYIGFKAMAPWMDGYARVRFPENINSRLGMHFLDNLAPDMPRVSKVEVPEWVRDDSGRLSYEVETDEGLVFAGAAWVDGPAVEMEFVVRNGTGQEQDINAQVCVDLSTTPTFWEQDRLDTTHAWFDGAYRSLAEGTSPRNKREQTGFNWVLMLYKEDPDEGLRTIEATHPWWILDQQADHPVIVRETPDGRNLIAVTWDRTVRRLMSNTNIPCLHADPLHCENLPDGGVHTWRGRLLLMENDPGKLLRTYRGRSED